VNTGRPNVADSAIGLNRRKRVVSYFRRHHGCCTEERGFSGVRFPDYA